MNFVIKNEHWTQRMEDLLFQDGVTKDPIEYIQPTTDMFDILVKAGVFKSKGDARKNWIKTGKEIPLGFSLFEKIGRKFLTIAIWVPFNTGD